VGVKALALTRLLKIEAETQTTMPMAIPVIDMIFCPMTAITKPILEFRHEHVAY
jgi:hypothetical protein